MNFYNFKSDQDLVRYVALMADKKIVDLQLPLEERGNLTSLPVEDAFGTTLPIISNVHQNPPQDVARQVLKLIPFHFVEHRTANKTVESIYSYSFNTKMYSADTALSYKIANLLAPATMRSVSESKWEMFLSLAHMIESTNYFEITMNVEDSDHLVAANNVIVDIKTFEEFDYGFDKFVLSKLATNWNPNVQLKDVPLLNNGKNLEEMLLSIFGNSQERLLMYKQIIRQAVLKYNLGESLINITGPAGSGKSTIDDLLKCIITGSTAPDYRICNTSWSDMHLDNKRLPLAQAHLQLAADAKDKEFINDTEELKQLASGEAVVTERKYKNAFSLQYKGIMVQTSASMLRIADVSGQIARRLVILRTMGDFTGQQESIQVNKQTLLSYLRLKSVREYMLKEALTNEQLANATRFLSVDQDYVHVMSQVNDPTVAFYHELDQHHLLQGQILPLPFVVAIYNDVLEVGLNSSRRKTARTFQSTLEELKKLADVTFNDERRRYNLEELKHLYFGVPNPLEALSTGEMSPSDFIMEPHMFAFFNKYKDIDNHPLIRSYVSFKKKS